MKDMNDMSKTIKIYVYRGIVTKVENIPKDWEYMVVDEDILEEN